MSVKAILYGQSYTKAEMDILLGNVQNTLQFDNKPSQDSPKLLTSGSIFTALESKADSSDLSGYATTASLTSGLNTKVNKSDITNDVEQENYNPVSSDGVRTAIDAAVAGLSPGGTAITVDPALSNSSTNPVQNKKIYEALEAKANSSDLEDYATTANLTSGLASKAPTNHASTETTYGTATGQNYGHVKLSDSINSSTSAASGGTAATPKALSDAVTSIQNAATPSVTWTDGTSAGPTLQVTVLNKNSTAAAIPFASATTSGIVTTGTQTFSGNKTVSGDLIIYKQSSIEEDVPAALYFQPAQTNGPDNDNYCYIKAYDDGDSNGAGTNLIMRSGGNLIIGGGESPSYFYTNVIKPNSRTTENTYVIADGVTFLYSNAGASGNDVSNRVGLAITTSGHIIPRHADPETNADADNNDVQNLGTSSNRWHIVYASTFNGTSFTGTATTATKLDNTSAIGSATQPVYFNANGVPVAITYTLGKSVPSNAVFTDTNQYHTTGSWNGLTYTATPVNSAAALAFTIPTGTTASTVAVGNHTHAISLATDTGTNNITLAYGGKYKLTAGGSSVIFTLPSDNNTDIKVKQNLKEGNYSYKLLFTSTTSPTDGTAGETGYNNAITVNPSSGTITATTFAGNASTASSATKLTTGRTLKVDLASTSASTAFNGTAAISDIGVSGVLAAANGGTGENTLKKSANALINALTDSTNTSYITQADDFIVAQYAGGGTTNTDFYRKAAKNVRVGGLTTARSLKVALGSTSAASFDGTADATTIGVSGTLPVARGGTGKTNTYLNGVIVGGATPSTEGGSSSTEAWQSIRTGSGAFFATARDAKPSFGTLPVAQGGTGVTSIANLKTALDIANNTTITTTSSKPKLLLTVGSDTVYPRIFLLTYHLSSETELQWHHLIGVQYSETGGIIWTLDATSSSSIPTWTPAAASFKINFSEAATCWVLGNCNFTASAST